MLETETINDWNKLKYYTYRGIDEEENYDENPREDGYIHFLTFPFTRKSLKLTTTEQNAAKFAKFFKFAISPQELIAKLVAFGELNVWVSQAFFF